MATQKKGSHWAKVMPFPYPWTLRLSCQWWGFIAIIASILLIAGPAKSDESVDHGGSLSDNSAIQIAVIAPRGIERARKKWMATGNYLSKVLDRDVKITPLSLSGMAQVVRDNGADFIIVNPGAYVELSMQYGVTALATMERRVVDHLVNSFGSVVFAKAEREDLSSLPDLVDRRLLAVSANSFSGYQVAWHELIKHGIDLATDLAAVSFTGFPQDKVVNGVLAGEADAGVVRTGVLEAMASEGKILLKDIRIIGQRSHPNFHILTSTDLYPEWAFAKLPNVPNDLAKAVLHALFSIEGEFAAAHQEGYAGWAVPQDYTPVHKLLRELNIGPYKSTGVTVTEIMRQYWMVAVFVVLLILGIGAHSLLARRLVTRRTAELTTANEDLRREEEERTQAEELNSRLGRILEHSWNEIYIFDAKNFNFILANRGALSNLGYTMAEMKDLSAYDIKPEYTCDTFTEVVRPLVEGTQDFLVFETFHERKDGSYYPVEARLQLLTTEDPPIYFAVINDITQRKAAEDALRQAHESLELKVEERTRDLAREKQRAENYLNIAGTMIVAIDNTGRVILVNGKACEVLGYEKNDMVGQNWFKMVIPPHEQNGAREEFDLILGGKLDPVEQFENTVMTRDGQHRLIAWRNTYIRDQDDNICGTLSAGDDITDNKKMQEQLIQSSKMATLGEMATGVAHELNQPLNVIRMAVSNIQRKSGKNTLDTTYLSKKLDKIDSQVERAAAIIDHMRIFGRKPAAKKAALDPVKMVKGSLSLIGEQLRLSSIEVDQDFENTENRILGHQVQIEQVLLNLITNARDALNIQEGNDKRIILRIRPADDARNVAIEVEDTGGGIDPEIMHRIFEPFYTSKDVGQGTGLGLSISYGIITEMGGTLEARNSKTGACFTISLPASHKEQMI